MIDEKFVKQLQDAEAEDNREYQFRVNVKQGDKVLLKSGKIAEFVKMKRTNFEGIIDGAHYNIKIASFDKIVEKANQDIKKEVKANILSQLKDGDWFYINKNDNALTFIFKEIKNNKIIGINPITKTTTKIDMNFEIGLIEMVIA